jgi:NHR1 homology to TAF
LKQISNKCAPFPQAGLITAEEFQRQVYDVVRLPLRPHIVSLLQKQVPIWQAEISAWVRESKQVTLFDSGGFDD